MKKFFPLLILIVLVFSSFSQQSSTKWQVNYGPQKVFIENKHQFDGMNNLPGSEILFGTDYGFSTIYFTKTGLTYRFDKREVRKKFENEEAYKNIKKIVREEEEEEPFEFKTDLIRMQWIGANPNVQVVAGDEATGYFNYSLGKMGSIDHVKSFNKITYKDLYPGIDVEYIFHPENGIEYSLILHPGADISMVKMRYSDTRSVSEDAFGNILLATQFGNITDHAPLTYYEGEKSNVISSKFIRSGKNVTFELGNYDHSKTVVIDPWTATPTLPSSNRAFYIKSDSSGNAYIYGGDSPFTLRKYNSSGVYQWTFATPWDSSSNQHGWFGTLQVDRAGNSFITAGSLAAIAKINTTGSQVWLDDPSSLVNEYWALTFNCDESKLIAGGNLNFAGGAMNINLSNGTVSNSLRVAGTSGFNPNEIRSLCYSPNGNYYGITLDTIVSFTSSLSLNYKNTSSFILSYGSPSYGLGTPQGQSIIRASATDLYTMTGATLQKRNINTGAIVTTATIPSGVTNTIPFIGGTSAGNGGIAIDSCGYIYVGSVNKVCKFDANLNLITSATTPNAVYDVSIATNGDVLACGQSFAVALNMTACSQMKSICQVVLSANATPANPNCNGQCTGSATASVTNGSSPYSYSWSNGQNTQTATNLCAGTYTVTITDASNNTVTAMATITQPAAINVNTTPVATTCGGTNGSVTANATSGTGPFSYSWSNGGSGQTINGIASGNYTVTATGAGGCTSTATAVVASSSGIVANATTTSSGCTANGSATANVSSGTGPFTYAWSNGGNSQTISNISSGTYTVTVTGASNCTATANAVVNSTGSSITLSTSSSSAGCASNGSATVTITAGTGPYSYSWSNGATTQTAANLSAGNYSVTVTGNGGCSATAAAIVSSSGSGVTLSATASDASCGATNGSATVTATTGTGPYTYSWSNGGSSQNITGLAAGTYNVTVTGQGGCSATASAVVNSTNAVNLTASSTQASCNQSNGSATVTVTAGSAPYSYSWSNGGNTSTISGLSSGVYQVTVTSSGNCTATASTTVTSSNGVTISTSSTPTTCGSTNGTVSVTTSTGTAPFTYSWDNGQTSASQTGLAAGTYTVTVSDNNGCSATASAVVNPSGNGSVTATADNSIFCSGDSTRICATGGYASYAWNTGETTQCIYTRNAGNYYLTVTDNGNCTATSNRVSISVYPPPPVAISILGDTLTAYNSPTYQWYYNGNPIPGATSAVYIATQTGYYSVQISDSNSCTALSNPAHIVISGINEIGDEGRVAVYPNPTVTGSWNVDVSPEWLQSKVEIVDDNGRLVYSGKLVNSGTTLELNVAKGIYLMRLLNEKNSITIKLMRL